MGHYALLNNNNFVDQVITGGGNSDDIMFETLYGDFHNCIAKRTSYNTRGGIHYTNGQPSQDQSKAFRKNYAGIGYYYDNIKDAFIPPKSYPSWILDEFSCLWNPPISYPDTTNILEPYIWYNIYYWDEETLNWKLNKPFDSWSLNPDNYYVSPISYPNDGNNYYWNEDILNWQLII